MQYQYNVSLLLRGDYGDDETVIKFVPIPMGKPKQFDAVMAAVTSVINLADRPEMYAVRMTIREVADEPFAS